MTEMRAFGHIHRNRGLVRPAAHAVVAGAERPADDDRELRHDAVCHGVHQLGAVARDAGAFVLAAHDEAGDVLQEEQRNPPQIAELDEVRALERGLREEHAVIGEDADQQPMKPWQSLSRASARTAA